MTPNSTRQQHTPSKLVGRWTALPNGSQVHDQLTIEHDPARASRIHKRKTARKSRRVNRRRAH